MEYVALSYVWGPAPLENNYLPCPAELTIEDSISVTLQMGFGFLSVDRYCIPQSDGSTSDQVNRMHLIYRDAEMTIIAVAGDSSSAGLAGVGQHTRKKQAICRLGSAYVFTGSRTLGYLHG
jgi:hypothetical protein